jgi:hypothetical protein
MRTFINTAFGLLALIAFFQGCATTPKPPTRQGLFGTFSTYRLPAPEPCDSLFATQNKRDQCKIRNETRLVEPLAGSVTVTRLDEERGQRVALGSDGAYRIQLLPGYYTVCLGKQCSETLEVRMNTFVAWGGQFPKDSVAAILSGAN